MHPTIALDEFEDEWPWPTFDLFFMHRFHAPIYTIFDPVMHPTIALDEFEDEWPWPTFLGLF